MHRSSQISEPMPHGSMGATAVTACWQAIRLRPRSAALYVALGRAYFAWGHYREAAAAWAAA